MVKLYIIERRSYNLFLVRILLIVLAAVTYIYGLEPLYFYISLGCVLLIDVLAYIKKRKEIL